MKIMVGFPKKDRLLEDTLRAVTPEYGWLPAQKGWATEFARNVI